MRTTKEMKELHFFGFLYCVTSQLAKARMTVVPLVIWECFEEKHLPTADLFGESEVKWSPELKQAVVFISKTYLLFEI